MRKIGLRMRLSVLVFFVLSFLLLQGCYSLKAQPSKVNVITVVKMKKKMEKNIESGFVEISPLLGKRFQNVVDIPDGNPCRLDPSGPGCLSGGILQACPAQSRLDLTPAVAQVNGTLCWAASCQSVVFPYGTDIQQCQIVSKVQKLGEDFCCQEGNEFHGDCWVNRWPGDCFTSLKYDYQISDGPLPLKKLAHVLCEYGPISFVILGHNGDGHTLVVKDLEYDPEGEVLLKVHPHNYVKDDQGKSVPAEFQMWSYDKFKRGLYQGYDETNSKHFTDYSQLEHHQDQE